MRLAFVCGSLVAVFGLVGGSDMNSSGLAAGNETHVRRKRYLAPKLSGWTFTFRPTLIVPMVTPFSSVFTQLFLLMPITVSMDKIIKVDRRSEDVRHSERVGFLQLLENTVNRIDKAKSGHACMLRTICEVASSPEVGGALSLLLTPDEDVDQLMERSNDDNVSEYLKAQRAGQNLNDCSKYEENCGMSLFESI